MHEMEELKQMLCDELEKITRKGELSAGSLDAVDKLTHSIKSIETIMAMNDYSNEGRSYDGNYGGSYGRSYRGRSYERGNGRRSRDYSGRRYSRDEGMMMLKEELEDLMDQVEPEQKKLIQKWIKQVED